MKKIVNFLAATLMCASCLSITSRAEVWEPEIVKTETWTANYYIDPEEDTTLYPYLECTVDIYNDGRIVLKVVNAHEFDGFINNIEHQIIEEYLFQRTTSNRMDMTGYPGIDNEDREVYKCIGRDHDKQGWVDVYQKDEKFKMNHIPAGYFCKIHQYSYSSQYYNSNTGHYYKADEKNYYTCQGTFQFKGPLAAFSKKSETIILVPTVEIKKEFYFNLFGHEITITPDLLKSSPDNTPTDARTRDELLTENEQLKARVEELEAENAALSTANSMLTEDNEVRDFKISSLTEQLKTFEKTCADLVKSVNEKIEEIRLLKLENLDLVNNPLNTDFNGDGKITVGDAVWYVNWLANRPAKLFNKES